MASLARLRSKRYNAMTAAAESASTRPDMGKLLQEAGLTAFLVFMLALPLGGFETVGKTVGLGLNIRPLHIIVPVVIAFVGRLLLLLLWGRARPTSQAKRGPSAMDQVARGVSTYSIYFVPVVLVFAIILPFLPFSNRYLIDTATSVLIYVMLGWGLNIVVGLAGLLDLGYVAFYAVGAYSYALLATELGWSFWACLPLAGLFAALAGIVLGFPVLRLRGDYLAIVTLGFGEIIRLILINWYDVTNGPDGISRIPRPSFFGLEFTRRPKEGVEAFHQFFEIPYAGEHRVIFLYFFNFGVALLTNVFTNASASYLLNRAWRRFERRNCLPSGD